MKNRVGAVGNGDVTSGVCQQQSRFRCYRNVNTDWLWEVTESISASSYPLTAQIVKTSPQHPAQLSLCFHKDCGQLEVHYCTYKYRKDHVSA